MLVSALAFGFSASAADVPVPLHLQSGYAPGGEFAVNSNGNWKVRLRTNTLVKPDVVSISWKGRPDQTAPWLRQDHSTLWAPDCSQLTQIVSFVRSVDLDGPPSELGFEWGWKAPAGVGFEYAQLYVNHTLAYTGTTRLTRFEHDKRKAVTRLFRDGVNHFEVRVKKKATPPGAPKSCNTGVQSRDLGVAFRIQGKFAADVAVRTDIPATEVRHVSDLTPVTGAIDIINHGPSAVYWGKFRFIIGGEFKTLLFVSGPSVSGQGVSGCKSSAPPQTFARTITIECDLRNMRAEARAVMSFSLVLELGSPGYGTLRYNREVLSSADDPNPKNNAHANAILLCTPNATNPACAG